MSHAPHHGGPTRRLRGDDGAALIEMAYVAPVLTLLFMAIVEYGMLYRDFLNLSSAVSEGAKYGAIQGPSQSTGNVTADYTVIRMVRENIATLPIENIDRIVVFKARSSRFGSPLAQVPQVCKTGSASDAAAKCNVYLISGVAQSASAFVQIEKGNTAFFDCQGTGPACGWPPISRKNGPKAVDIDDLGVYIKLKRPKVTGMVPVNTTVEVAAIQHLEPGVFE